MELRAARLFLLARLSPRPGERCRYPASREKRTMNRLTLLLFSAMLATCGSPCLAQRTASNTELTDVPVYPLAAIAAFQTGGWSEIEPKQGPKILKEQVPQIVIFATTDGESVFRLAKRVNDLVVDYQWGRWCALVVCHQNDLTLSETKWNEYFPKLKSKANQNQLTTISAGLGKRLPKNTRVHKRFDGFSGYDIAVFFRNAERKTQYMELLDSKRLDNDTLKRLSQQLHGLVESSLNVKREESKTQE